MMRVSALSLLALSALTPAYAGDGIVQTMYVPLPEEMLLNDIFENINSYARSPTTSLISMAIPAAGTVVYYDHWEDGFELDPENPTQSTTQIWGDGDPSNGCAPIPGKTCNAHNDILKAGDVLIVSDDIKIHWNGRRTSEIEYDGGDKISSTRPIAVTRAGYPAGPKAYMAGAVEVLETGMWGTAFEAPTGQDVNFLGTNSYEFTGMAFMAKDDGTVVTVEGVEYPLDEGESAVVRVNQGASLTSNKPVQVHLITGDCGSYYELRFYTLAPTEQWSNVGYAPVGDTKGQVRLFIYNPSDTKTIDVTVTTLTDSSTLTINPKKSYYSHIIKDGEAAKVTSDDKFFAYSSTDNFSSGQIYDWGYPLMSREQLTDQVIIGLGYGCTDNNCGSTGERSVVWVSPVTDAWIHVDYDNDGVVDDTFYLKELEGKYITDDSDEDMSGAIIWGTKEEDPQSESIDIAAAWGQKAAFAGTSDRAALDLGTVIIPFDPVRASCMVEFVLDANNNGIMDAGDIVKQKITVSNSGVKSVGTGQMAVDTLMGPKIIPNVPRGETEVMEIEYTIPSGRQISPQCETQVVPAPPSLTNRSFNNNSSKQKGSSSGDPHFKTWTGEKYDYHGECDLVLVDNPSFNDGMGLRVHIRTTRVKYFSFVEKVAVQIGDEVLEFDNDIENFYINGKHVGENQVHHKTMLGGFIVRRDKRALSIRLHDEGKVSREAGTVTKIDLHTRKNGFPAVIVDAGHTDVFKGSLGMLGEFGTGRTLGRDGETEIEINAENAEAFALEWQVRDTDPSLFMENRFPQFPQLCIPPQKMMGARLGMSKKMEEAKEACAHWKEDVEDCIFDVIATQDIMVAEEGHIVHVE